MTHTATRGTSKRGEEDEKEVRGGTRQRMDRKGGVSCSVRFNTPGTSLSYGERSSNQGDKYKVGFSR